MGTAQKFANFWEGVHTVIGLPDSHHALIVRNGLPREAARKVHLDQIKTFKERTQEIEPIFPIRSAEVDTVSEPLNELLSAEDNDQQLHETAPVGEPNGEEATNAEPARAINNPSQSRSDEMPSTLRGSPRETRQHFVRACWPHKTPKVSSLQLAPKRRSYEYVPTQKTTRSGRSIKPVTRFSSHRY